MNLGNPQTFSIRQLAEMVLDMTGSKSELKFSSIPPDDPKRRQPDISKAKSLLGWTRRTNLEDGLKPTIQYFDGLLRQERLKDRPADVSEKS